MMKRIEPLTENVAIHQTLGDNPNTDNNLSADELKVLFDKAAVIIKDYLNSTVVEGVNGLNSTMFVSFTDADDGTIASDTKYGDILLSVMNKNPVIGRYKDCFYSLARIVYPAADLAFELFDPTDPNNVKSSVLIMHAAGTAELKEREIRDGKTLNKLTEFETSVNDRLDTLSGEMPVVVVCGGGTASMNASEIIAEHRKNRAVFAVLADDMTVQYQLSYISPNSPVQADFVRAYDATHVRTLSVDDSGNYTISTKVIPQEVTTAVITTEVGRLVCDMTASQIIDASRRGIVKAEYTDDISRETREYYYFKQMPDGRAVFTKDGYIEDGVPKQTLFYVDYAGNVTAETRTPTAVTCYATCTAAAAPVTSEPVAWYVSKAMPKPSGNVGMMIDVFWKHGRADGIGYDISLIWGEEGGSDNETIVPTAPTTDPLTGQYSIPTEGTVRYQLIEQSGRLRWQYVSGRLIPKQFSSATAAATADKIVPGMSISYLPGMDVYVALDSGNTADAMRLVPDDGATLPVYGNGGGAKTGTIPAGYILHLINAGDHWQMVNSPSTKNQALTITTKTDDGNFVTTYDGTHAEGIEIDKRTKIAVVKCRGNVASMSASEIIALHNNQVTVIADVDETPTVLPYYYGNDAGSSSWVRFQTIDQSSGALVRVALVVEEDKSYNLTRLPAPAGVSLGLTGMQIGDTVEVASIGPGGVPTGWKKPGKWELIETVQGNDMPIIRDKEPNGTPYAFKALRLYIAAPEMFSISAIRVWLEKAGSPVPLFVEGVRDKFYWSAEIFENRGYWDAEICDKSLYPPIAGPVKKLGREYSQNWPVQAFTYINKIDTQSVIPSGVTMRIEAVRA